MPTTNETRAPAPVFPHVCMVCGGFTYTVHEKCCGLGSISTGMGRVFDCGGSGCIGAQTERLDCEACHGKGVVE